MPTFVMTLIPDGFSLLLFHPPLHIAPKLMRGTVKSPVSIWMPLSCTCDVCSDTYCVSTTVHVCKYNSADQERDQWESCRAACVRFDAAVLYVLHHVTTQLVSSRMHRTDKNQCAHGDIVTSIVPTRMQLSCISNSMCMDRA